eukprot:scaffold2219_cov177-Amphora_coffeaeformis.AAC.8
MRMQKKLYEDGKKTTYLNDEKIQALENIGFDWGKRKGDALWDEKFQELLQFKETFGHCHVPIKWSENRILGRWVSTQRKEYKNWREGKRSLMTDERHRRLEAVGFAWAGNDSTTDNSTGCSNNSGQLSQMETATTSAETTLPMIDAARGANADPPGCIDHSGKDEPEGCITRSGEIDSSGCVYPSEIDETTVPILNVTGGGNAESEGCIDQSGKDESEDCNDHSETDESSERCSLSRSSSCSTIVVGDSAFVTLWPKRQMRLEIAPLAAFPLTFASDQSSRLTVWLPALFTSNLRLSLSGGANRRLLMFSVVVVVAAYPCLVSFSVTIMSSAPVVVQQPLEERLRVAPSHKSASFASRKRASFWFQNWLAISQFLDPLRIPNSYVNYQCVWWKAMAANDRNSPVFDGGLAYDLLPSVTRWAAASPVVSWYPRFHHANVELRTAYLDQAMEQVLLSLPQSPQQAKVRLVLLGGGYDLRLIRMALKYNATAIENTAAATTTSSSSSVIAETIEVDLPQVIAAKQRILKERFLRRRPELKNIIDSVQTFPIDLNDLEGVRKLLHEFILVPSSNGDDLITVFVFEAVLIYLDEGIPSQLLALLSQAVRSAKGKGAILVADTLPLSDVDASEDLARKELETLGWVLKDWNLKPGRTRHLGWAAT